MSLIPKQNDSAKETMRLDKWLWCARFYKTRSLAAEAIKNGKITVNEIRAKPARLVQIGDNLVIKRGPFNFDISITSLSKGRKSAKETSQLYAEDPQGHIKREKLLEQLKLVAALGPKTRGKPTKRDRREIIRFKNRV